MVMAMAMAMGTMDMVSLEMVCGWFTVGLRLVGDGDGQLWMAMVLLAMGERAMVMVMVMAKFEHTSF